MPTTTKSKTQPKQAFALHASSKNGDAVGIGNLRVLLTDEEGAWFAQGLEIDYATQGVSFEDVKHKFEEGLRATIKEHLRIFGSIENLLVTAPDETWQEFFVHATGLRFRHSQVSFHAPVGTVEIEYRTRTAA